MKRWLINEGILKEIRLVMVVLLIYGAVTFVLFAPLAIGAKIVGKYYADEKFHKEQSIYFTYADEEKEESYSFSCAMTIFAIWMVYVIIVYCVIIGIRNRIYKKIDHKKDV